MPICSALAFDRVFPAPTSSDKDQLEQRRINQRLTFLSASKTGKKPFKMFLAFTNVTLIKWLNNHWFKNWVKSVSNFLQNLKNGLWSSELENLIYIYQDQKDKKQNRLTHVSVSYICIYKSSVWTSLVAQRHRSAMGTNVEVCIVVHTPSSFPLTFPTNPF